MSEKVQTEVKDFDDVNGMEPLTKELVGHLVQAFGSVGMPIIMELGNIDYDAGRGVLTGNDRCFWTKDGKRITVRVGASQSMSISNDVDPYYLEAFGGGDRDGE